MSAPGQGTIVPITDTGSPPKPAPTRRGRAAVTSMTVACVAAALLALVHLPAMRDRARRYLENTVRARFDIALSIGRLDYSLLTLSASASNVTAAATRSADAPFFRAGRLAVRLRPSVLIGHLAFASIDVVRPVIALTRDAGGGYRLPSIGTGSGPTPRVLIDRLSIQNLDLHVEGTPPLTVDARDVSASLEGRAARISGRLHAARGVRVGTTAGAVLDIGFDGTIGLAPESLLIGPLALTLPQSRVTVEGTMPFAPGPSRLDLSYRASVNLADAARFWPVIAPARGRIDGAGTIAGELSHLVLTFDASSHSASVRGTDAAAARVRGSVGDGKLTLTEAAIDVAGGRVTASGEVGMARSANSRLSAECRGLDIQALLQTLAFGLPLPLGSTLDGQARFAWNHGGLPSLRMTAGLTARPAPGNGKADLGARARALPVGGQTSLRIEGSRWTLGLDHQLGDHSTIVGTLFGHVNAARFGATSLEGRLTSSIEADDVASAVELLEQRDGASKHETAGRTLARLHGRLTASLDVSGTISAPAAATTLSADNLRVDGLGEGSLHAGLALNRREALFDELSGELGGARFGASGLVPFDQRPLALSFQADVPDVSRWLGEVPSKWRPSGALVARGNASGTLSAPLLSVRLASSNASWPFWSPGALDADVRLSPDRAEFEAHVASVHGLVNGHVALSPPYEFDIASRLDEADLASLGTVVANLGAPRFKWTGTTTLAARVTGAAGTDDNVRFEISAEELIGSIDDHPLRLLQPARLQVSRERVTAERLRLQLGSSILSATGGLGSGADGPLRMEAEGDLHEWWPRASGQFRADLRASGSPDRPTLAGEARLLSASVGLGEWEPLLGIEGAVKLADGTLAIDDGRASWAGAPVTLTGRVPLGMLSEWLPEALTQGPPAPGAQLHVRATASAITAKAFQRWIGPEAVGEIRGQLGAELDLAASALRLDAMTGTAVITQSPLTLAALTLTQAKPARLAIAGGRIRVENAAWTAGARTIRLEGGIDVRPAHPVLDLSLVGDVELGLARAFVPLAVSGSASIDARVTGDTGRPSLAGGATLRDVSLGLARPRVAFSSGTGTLTLQHDRLILNAQGNMNGGRVEIGGALPLRAKEGQPAPADVLSARGTGFLIEWPEGLRSTVDADLTYRYDTSGGVLAGAVTVAPGAYRRAAPPTFSSRKSPEEKPSAPSFFDGTRLDVTIATRTPGLMDNSYARVEIDGALRIGGTVGEPAVGGRLQARENGEVYLRGNVFRLDRGTLDFTPGSTTPSVSVVAATRRSGYDIRLRLDGRVDDLRVMLTSDPPLAQPDLMSLITTGSTSNSMGTGPAGSGNGHDALVAAISSDILGLAGKSVGLDSVRVGELDLDLMGDDVDPETRLTIGKSIGSWLDLLLSQNLRESGFTWAITVHPYGKVAVRFVSADSKTNSLQLSHEVIFGQPGGTTRPPKPAKIEKNLPRVASVRLSGGDLPEREVLDVISVRQGDRFEFFKWQRDRERIEALFHEHGYLQAQVSAARETTTDGAIDLAYAVRPGPQTRLDVIGVELPDTIVEGMKSAWSQAVDDRFLHEDLLERARRGLIDLGYFWPKVEVDIAVDPGGTEKVAALKIDPGPRASGRELVFEGRYAVAERDLREALASSAAGAGAWHDTPTAAAALQDFYRKKGFLRAKVSAGQPVLAGGKARLALTIDEGPRHVVSRLEIHGALPGEVRRVEQWIGWKIGQPFDPLDSEAAAKRIQAGYANDGYRQVRAAVTSRIEGATGADGHVGVTVVADVQLGTRSVVGAIEVLGRGETRETIVRRAIDMAPGDAASAKAVDRAQRRLYETEAFRSVDVELKPIDAASPHRPTAPDTPPTPAGSGALEQPTKVVVTLEEAPLYRLRYGVQLTDDLTVATQINNLRPGFSGELRRRNLFGTALTGGVAGRYEVNNWSVRGALNIPSSVWWPALSTVYFKASKSTDQGDTGPVVTRDSSLTYQERWRLGQRSELSYGYAFTREQLSYLPTLRSAVTTDEPTNRGNLFSALAWDRRDSAFDATRGWFHSSSLEYGAPALGSDYSYLRYLFQQTFYKKVSRLVLAGAARVGVLGHLTGTDAETYSLRFRTGGDRTVRGYEEESLSASGAEGDALAGGRGLLVLNGELRFPVWKWLKGAAFLDAGNAFVDPQHISLKQLEVGTGFGIRLDTPYALFRFDLGFPVPQAPPGQPVRIWYFSIGQAF